MALRTQEQVQQFLAERKRIKEQEKQREIKRYRKAQESIKRILARKYKGEVKQMQPGAFKTPKKASYISVYTSNLIEREPPEDNLYQSWEELKEAEERGEGELNWSKLFQLIDRTRKNVVGNRKPSNG